MSFQRRLFITVTLVLASMLFANFFVSVYNAKSYFSDQMAVLSQDAATSLALVISKSAKEKDLAQINSMVDVIFDSGYYLSISYVGIEGNLVASRAREIVIDGVPDWFIDWIDLPTSSGSAEVQSGWFRLGEIHVVAHPGFGYQDLWRVVSELIWLLVVSVVLTYGLVGLLVSKLIAPLYRLEKQAEAIAREDFSPETIIPREPEFKRVVLAMNSMAKRIQETFNQQLLLVSSLRREAHSDPLTELPNRQEFDSRLNAWLATEYGQGAACLVLISVGKLDELNQQLGRDGVDKLLLDIAELLKRCASDNSEAIIGRRTGADFAMYLPGVFPAEVQAYANKLREQLDDIPSAIYLAEDVLHLGVAYAATAKSALMYLTAADESLRQNKATVAETLCINLEEMSVRHRSASEWLPLLESIVESEALRFYYQPIFLKGAEHADHFEVLCRIKDDNEIIQAGSFWPLVERFGLNEVLDKVVITRVLGILAANEHLRLCVNVSAASVRSAAFRDWLYEQLRTEPEGVRRRLIIELPEVLFRHVDSVLRPVIVMLSEQGLSVSIDRFGLMASSIAYLNDLPISFVKLDRRFVSGIHNNHENRFYVRTLHNVCFSCGVILLTEGIEDQDELDTLKELDVGGYQGYFLGRPESEFD